MGELARTLHLTLPWPPSLNHYWRRVGHRTLISRAGRQYREAVWLHIRRQGVQDRPGRLRVEIDAYPPDRRRRDLDNALKALLDAMEHGGVYQDDSQIDELEIVRCEIIRGGQVCVRITEIDKDAQPTDTA